MRSNVIDLALPHPGFYHFYSSWLIELGDKVAVLDPGPAATIDTLLTTLRAHSVQTIDYLLLTHIHLDHAGCAGRLIREFPVKVVICHPQAIPHLIDPSRLWAGSLATLGPLAEMLGEPEAVPESLLRSYLDIESVSPEITAIPSPGHAPHHVSYLVEDRLFVGEALGVVLPEAPGYVRPATPPKFVPSVYLNSIDRLREVPSRVLCFGHFGAQERCEAHFEDAKMQVEIWMRVLGELSAACTLDEKIEKLMEEDPRFERFSALPPSLREREKRFIANSILGMEGALENR
jgi:glyoxylase-like metal-dependent hydrolase (beta-lactamase superfamily II)